MPVQQILMSSGGIAGSPVEILNSQARWSGYVNNTSILSTVTVRANDFMVLILEPITGGGGAALSFNNVGLTEQARDVSTVIYTSSLLQADADRINTSGASASINTRVNVTYAFFRYVTSIFDLGATGYTGSAGLDTSLDLPANGFVFGCASTVLLGGSTASTPGLPSGYTSFGTFVRSGFSTGGFTTSTATRAFYKAPTSATTGEVIAPSNATSVAAISLVGGGTSIAP